MPDNSAEWDTDQIHLNLGLHLLLNGPIYIKYVKVSVSKAQVSILLSLGVSSMRFQYAVKISVSLAL